MSKQTLFIKIVQTILVCFCVLNTPVFSQSQSDRIAEIKRMYSEVTQLGEKNCIVKTMVDKIDVSGEFYEVEQKAEFCDVNSTYTIVKGVISDWEYEEELFAYYVNGKLFFVFIKFYNVAFEGELRYYFYENGDVAQILQKNNENGDDLNIVPNSKVESEEEKNEFLSYLYGDMEKIQQILGQQ
jgi:hypothetical protein